MSDSLTDTCTEILNYVLVGKDSNTIWNFAKELADNTRNKNPAFFNADKTYIPYEMKYIPPFDKDFVELKHLQIAASRAAPLSRKYHGYFLLDLTKYIGHESEDYFDISLKFLRDNASDWAYVFIISKEPVETRAMLDKISSLFFDTSIKCINVGDESEKNPAIYQILSSLHADCTPRVEFALQRLIDNNLISAEQTEIMIREILQENKAITKHNVLRYLDDPEVASFLKMILSPNRFIAMQSAFKEALHEYDHESTL